VSKTHWKKIVSDPNFIGEADFAEGEEKVLTLDYVNHNETITTAEGKSQKAVAHWKEPGNKPMILNVARSKAIEKVAGSPYFEDWVDVKIQLYIEHGIKAFGDVVSAVRVRPRKPQIRNAILCEDCGQEIQGANGRNAEYIAAYTKKKFKVCLCFNCAQKRSEAPQNQEGEVDGQTEIDG
jgi:hypothetical protein